MRSFTERFRGLFAGDRLANKGARSEEKMSEYEAQLGAALKASMGKMLSGANTNYVDNAALNIHRLALRYEQIENAQKGLTGLIQPVESEDFGNHLNHSMMVYRLAVTDVFVSKSISVLQGRSSKHKKNGQRLLLIGMVSLMCLICVDIVFLWSLFFEHKGDELNDHLIRMIGTLPISLIVITLAINFWKFGRANIDQSERLVDRVHALRQGRLYMHLNCGEVGIDDFERAFNWSIVGHNAFGNPGMEPKMAWDAAVSALAEALTKAEKNSPRA